MSDINEINPYLEKAWEIHDGKALTHESGQAMKRDAELFEEVQRATGVVGEPEDVVWHPFQKIRHVPEKNTYELVDRVVATIPEYDEPNTTTWEDMNTETLFWYMANRMAFVERSSDAEFDIMDTIIVPILEELEQRGVELESVQTLWDVRRELVNKNLVSWEPVEHPYDSC